MKDRHEEARAILHRLHEPHEADKEFVQIEAQMRIDKTLDTSYWVMIKRPSYRKRLLLSLACTGFNQFSGILVITSKSIQDMSTMNCHFDIVQIIALLSTRTLATTHPLNFSITADGKLSVLAVVLSAYSSSIT